MNKKLEDYARQQIKDGLSQLPESHKTMFKRMYSHTDLNKDITAVVDDMPTDKLDWAMQQVERSIQKTCPIT